MRLTAPCYAGRQIGLGDGGNVEEDVNELEAIVIEDEALRAIDGDRDALEKLVRALQGDIYGLCIAHVVQSRRRGGCNPGDSGSNRNPPLAV